MEGSDKCSVTYEDQRNITFLVKEYEKVEPRLILRDTISFGNQIKHDQFYEVTVTSATTASPQSGKKMKTSLGEGIGENHDGFQTPTKVLDMISVTGLKCPPAPMMPKVMPLEKRRRECTNLQVEFVNEVELVLRLLITEEDTKLKKARPLAAGEANGSSLGA